MSTLWVQLRCVKCHDESSAQKISLSIWPAVRVDKSLRCGHRHVEIRLYEEAPQDIAIVEGLLAKE